MTVAFAATHTRDFLFLLPLLVPLLVPLLLPLLLPLLVPLFIYNRKTNDNAA